MSSLDAHADSVECVGLALRYHLFNKLFYLNIDYEDRSISTSQGLHDNI